MQTIQSRSADSASLTNGETTGIARYLQSAVLAVLLGVAFWPILVSMFGSWLDDKAYMDHGLLVVPAAAYMVSAKWSKLVGIPRSPSAWGVLLLLLGALSATLGLAAHFIWVGRMAFLVSLVGLILAVYGFRMVRELVYPLCTLIFMVAPPSFVYERVTLSLQLLASRLGEVSLESLGYSVVREGNILELVGVKLSIEEACSGLRSLLSITFMCTLYNYFFVNGNRLRAFILVMAVPIAVLGNVFRIVATGVASQYNKELVHGEAHELFGYVSIVAAGAGCILLHVVVLNIQKVWRSRHA